MTAQEKEIKNLKAKQKSLIKESVSVLQRIEHLEKIAQEKNGVEADSIQIAVLKASLRRGYK